MDVHVFRRFCDALSPLLLGARLEKIQSPLEDIFVFTFYAKQKKQHLVLKAGRRDAFCYIAKERPVADAPPSALVMRWRKYCSGRRVVSCTADWIGRRLLLLFHTNNPDIVAQNPPQTWLVLDLRHGPQLFLGKSPSLEFTEEDISWPTPEHLADACDNWRHWPVLTPALRRFLPQLDPMDSGALLMDLEAGGGDLFVYEQKDAVLHALEYPENTAKQAATISAWPLLITEQSSLQERVFEDPLEATSYIGDALVLGVGAEKIRHKAALPHQREAARLERLLTKVNEDEGRLLAMAQAQEIGLVLQSELWKYAADVKLASIETDNAAYPRIMLDAKLTVRDNMQALFHKAGRGRRGLEYLQKRREELQAQLHAAQSRALVVEAGAHDLREKKGRDRRAIPALSSAILPTLPKGVQAFKSSDGFIILRGKDAKGNGAALRAAAAKDIWLHVEGGPGSHCIIRRHFSGQDIPERTFMEAASLAAVKSWQKDSPTAQILSAEVRHVKPMRGAATGTVRIDKVLRSFRVDITANIEAQLLVS